MDALISDLSVAESEESGLKSKCVGLGTGSITTAQETNITGVQENVSVYEECASVLKQYKELLDTDATHIKELGVNFFDVDHQIAEKMQR